MAVQADGVGLARRFGGDPHVVDRPPIDQAQEVAELVVVERVAVGAVVVDEVFGVGADEGVRVLDRSRTFGQRG